MEWRSDKGERPRCDILLRVAGNALDCINKWLKLGFVDVVATIKVVMAIRDALVAEFYANIEKLHVLLATEEVHRHFKFY